MEQGSIFQVSAAGMRIERMRLDATALNIANMNTSRTQAGGIYKPIKVVAHATGIFHSGDFGEALSEAATEAQGLPGLAGAPQAQVVTMEVSPRKVHEPGHPDADAQGNVSYPGVDHLGEMVNMMTALRAYEANVIAMNATKLMISKTLEIGGGT
jgi:flagellar basal-body rod protein FlgC